MRMTRNQIAILSAAGLLTACASVDVDKSAETFDEDAYEEDIAQCRGESGTMFALRDVGGALVGSAFGLVEGVYLGAAADEPSLDQMPTSSSMSPESSLNRPRNRPRDLNFSRASGGSSRKRKTPLSSSISIRSSVTRPMPRSLSLRAVAKESGLSHCDKNWLTSGFVSGRCSVAAWVGLL